MRTKLILLCIPLVLLFSGVSFAAQLYITTSATPGGMVTPLKGRNAVATNGSLNVTFTANDGYYLAEIKVDREVKPITSRKSMTWQFTNITANHTIAAKFLRDPYIMVTKTPGGTVTPSPKAFVPYGSGQDVSITALDGYYLAEIKVNNVARPLTSRKTMTWQFTNVTANQRLAVKFLKDPFVTVTKSPGGTVTPAGKVFVPYSTSRTFTYAPQTGYHLESVTADRVKYGTPEDYTFTCVKTNHTLNVKFAINTYSVTTNAGNGGSITPASFPAVNHGQKKVFAVKPASGMCIATLTVNGTPVEGLPPSGHYSLPLTITENTVIAATFTEYVASGLERLKGSYIIVSDENSFWRQSGVNGSISSHIAADRITASFDGNGGCKIGITGNSYNKETVNGNESVHVDPTRPPSSCAYTVNDAEGTFTLTMSRPGETDSVTGWVSTDNNVIISGGFEQSSDTKGNEYSASTVTGVRSGSGITRATAAGTYRLLDRETALLKSQPQGGKTSVSDDYFGGNITVTLNATGGCVFTIDGVEFSNKTDNVGNEYVDVFAPGALSVDSCTYTIAANGAFTVKVFSSGTLALAFNGWASADGNAIVMGDAGQYIDEEGTSYIAAHTFGVRDGSGMSVASVNGTYKLIRSDFTLGQSTENGKSHVNKSLFGNKADAIFDGNGGCTINFTGEGYSVDSGNSTIQVEPVSGTITQCSYSVGPDGDFTLNLKRDGEAETSRGRVSADGSSLLTGGPVQRPDDVNTYLYEVILMVGTRIKMP